MKVKRRCVVKPESNILSINFLLFFYWFPIANNKHEGVLMDDVFLTPSEPPKTPTQRSAIVEKLLNITVQKVGFSCCSIWKIFN